MLNAVVFTVKSLSDHDGDGIHVKLQTLYSNGPSFLIYHYYVGSLGLVLITTFTGIVTQQQRLKPACRIMCLLLTRYFGSPRKRRTGRSKIDRLRVRGRRSVAIFRSEMAEAFMYRTEIVPKKKGYLIRSLSIHRSIPFVAERHQSYS